jgi:predicted PurR-regulated permease PerM
MTFTQPFLLGAALVAGAGVLLYLLAPILTPFLIAALFAHITSPVVDALERRGVARVFGVIAVFVVAAFTVTALVLILVPMISRQAADFASRIPGYLDWLLNTAVPWLQHTLGVDMSWLDREQLKQQAVQHWQELGGAARQVFSYAARSGLGVAAWLLNLVLIPVVTFYLLRDWDRILVRARELLPPRWRATAVRLLRETDAVLGSFLRGQLAVMFILACVYSSGLWLVGLDLALPIGLVAGLVSFVPYLGLIVGLASAALAAVVQFQDSSALVWVAVVFGIGQALEGMVLTPYLVGGRIGLHPVVVIFAVMAGGQLFGFVGVLLALPLSAVIVVWLRHLHARYQKSALYRRPKRP